jgi:hypothetical protein
VLQSPAVHVQKVIDDKTIQPRPELTGSLDFLRRVFGFVWEIHHSKRDVVDPPLVPCDQTFQRIPVAALYQTDKFSVLGVTDRHVSRERALFLHVFQ